MCMCELCTALVVSCTAVFGLHGVCDHLVGNRSFLVESQAWYVIGLCFLVSKISVGCYLKLTRQRFVVVIFAVITLNYIIALI